MSNSEPDIRSRFTGCLLAAAIGDCLGAAYEGYSGSDLAEAYYDGRFQPSSMTMGEWTDDTSMLVATAKSLAARGEVDGEDLARRYLAWFEAGGRGIGRATYHAMKRIQGGTDWREAGEKGQYAAGNGVAMRVAPIGLFHVRDLAGLDEDVRTCGIITHRNDEAIAGGIAMAYVVARAAAGQLDPETIILEVLDRLEPCRVSDGLSECARLLEADEPPLKALPQLRLGGAAFETVPTAFYCFLRTTEDLKEALVSSIVAGGDTDTRACMAGAISGAFNGREAVPARWLSQLHLRSGIEGVAEQLCDVVTGS
ncbi:MAG: ADP-ribosylglycohydrolase family protein [Armatimonadota bacterium]|nr:ADP-ribosylglycohydrolase family protein [Armatimonadota bacterium]